MSRLKDKTALRIAIQLHEYCKWNYCSLCPFQKREKDRAYCIIRTESPINWDINKLSEEYEKECENESK